ncbi:hypothetical protein KCU99_g149, partial [Aureobasidium melanogenum]
MLSILLYPQRHSEAKCEMRQETSCLRELRDSTRYGNRILAVREVGRCGSDSDAILAGVVGDDFIKSGNRFLTWSLLYRFLLQSRSLATTFEDHGLLIKLFHVCCLYHISLLLNLPTVGERSPSPGIFFKSASREADSSLTSLSNELSMPPIDRTSFDDPLELWNSHPQKQVRQEVIIRVAGLNMIVKFVLQILVPALLFSFCFPLIEGLHADRLISGAVRLSSKALRILWEVI